MTKNTVIEWLIAISIVSIFGWLGLFYYSEYRLPIVKAQAYTVGRQEGQCLETERVREIVRQGRVYLAPLEMTKEGQVVHDCIFIGMDPNEPFLNVNASRTVVADCFFNMTQNDTCAVYSDCCDIETKFTDLTFLYDDLDGEEEEKGQ